MKYTAEQLVEMCLEVIRAYHTFDPRAEEMIFVISNITGAQPQFIWNWINNTANGR